MTPVRLLMSLKDALSEELKEYRYETESERKTVGVYLQLSDENFIDEKIYPLVLINLETIQCEVRNQIAQVEITIGTYGEEEESIIDLLNILERIRQYLLKNTIINQRFLLQYPITAEISNQSPYPFKFGYINAKYTIATL